MVSLVRNGHTFSHRGLLYASSPAAPYRSIKEPIPADGNTSAQNLKCKPMPPNGRTTKEWTSIAWPTNMQYGKPDGIFGPAKMMAGWGDCWFLAVLAAVANDTDGHKILTESIRKAKGGYDVTFKGMPAKNIFISDAELKKLVKTQGGDADTRLMELAADKFFNESGNFKSLFIASLIRAGMNQENAKQCLQDFCNDQGIQDPMTYNPMRATGHEILAFFMFTGLCPDTLVSSSSATLQQSDILAYLNRYVTDDSNGASVVIGTQANPLGKSTASHSLVLYWDVIRTEIALKKSSTSRLNKEQQAFLNALEKGLETRMPHDLQALKSAAKKLKYKHFNPVDFVVILSQNLAYMNPEHVNLLRSGVREVLAGGPGFIGFTGHHVGTMEGIDEAAGTFTYSEPNYPELVHTGELSDLIQAVRSGDVSLLTVDTASQPDDKDSQHSEHAGTSRGRRLSQIHNQVVRDGKIEQAESGPLADLMAMDDDTFWQLYDSDKNGVIEGGELKAVQLRVDRWIEHLKLTPIW